MLNNKIATTSNDLSIPVQAGKYSSTSAVALESSMAKETANKLVTISAMGQFCARLAANYGTPAYEFSRKAVSDFGSLTADDAARLYDFARHFYGQISTMCDLREIAAGAASELKVAENAVKESADGWFLWLGTRKPKNGQTKPRGIYGVRYADFAIFGEIAGEARKAAGEDLGHIVEKFAELLCLSAGRIIMGKPLGRISANELKAARKAAVAAKTAKAAATKEENKRKAEAAAAAKTEEERKEQAEKTAKANKTAAAANTLMESIRNSSATETEKAEMVDLVKALVATMME